MIESCVIMLSCKTDYQLHESIVTMLSCTTETVNVNQPVQRHPYSSTRMQTMRSWLLCGAIRNFCATIAGSTTRRSTRYVLLFARKI